MKFKEAFSPTFVVQALASLPERPGRCLDPFGGSGTTAITCAFLGIESVSIEVNPFLADLIEAKLTSVRTSDLSKAYASVLARARHIRVNPGQLLASAPKTLREPGVNGRFVFSAAALDRILALRQAIESIESTRLQRLLRVLLGSILVEASNVVVNGKGRRYRGGWQSRRPGADTVNNLFDYAVRCATWDLARYGGRREVPATVLRGDSRVVLRNGIPEADVAIFSPPYPNSFDYTDVYNLELWVLGYLDSPEANRALRLSTIRSHVQVSWKSQVQPQFNSRTLARTLAAIAEKREQLWDERLCEMVEGYFADMQSVLVSLRSALGSPAHVIVVVGDSCYASVKVSSAKILREIARANSYAVLRDAPIRAIRNSAQHGGKHELEERCLVLRPH